MSCEICGRGSCTRSFHSLEEQNSFDDIADEVKSRLSRNFSNRIDRLNVEYVVGSNDPYVSLQEVLDIVGEYA